MQTEIQLSDSSTALKLRLARLLVLEQLSNTTFRVTR